MKRNLFYNKIHSPNRNNSSKDIYLFSESNKSLKQFLGLSFLLISLHLLGFKTNAFTAFGLDIEIKDQKIIYGLISIIVIYKFYTHILFERLADNYKSLNFPSLEQQIRQKNYKSHWHMHAAHFFMALFFLPFIIGALWIIIFGLILAIYDVYHLANFLITESFQNKCALKPLTTH